jgi:hypothetical protein
MGVLYGGLATTIFTAVRRDIRARAHAYLNIYIFNYLETPPAQCLCGVKSLITPFIAVTTPFIAVNGWHSIKFKRNYA